MNTEYGSTTPWREEAARRAISPEASEYDRALQRFVEQVFTNHHIAVGSPLLELGVNGSQLAAYVPEQYYPFASTMSFTDNLPEALPLDDDSQAYLVTMDTVDLAPNIPAFLGEVRRVLRPGGMFVAFGVDSPRAAMLFRDFPDQVIIPSHVDRNQAPRDILIFNRQQLGMTHEYIRDALTTRLLGRFLQNPRQEYDYTVANPTSGSSVKTLVEALTGMQVEAAVIPSLPEYLLRKIITATHTAGWQSLEADFRQASYRANERSDIQNSPQNKTYNQFALEYGIREKQVNRYLQDTYIWGPGKIAEKVIGMVFVAKKIE